MLTATENDGENIYKEWMYHEIRRPPSNIIPKAKETWDVQDSDGHCEVGTGQCLNLERMMIIMLQNVNSEIYTFRLFTTLANCTICINLWDAVGLQSGDARQMSPIGAT
jgi:hypothetical protein